MIENYADDLIEFADSGQICNVCNLTPILQKGPINYRIYRGLLFPTEWLKSGKIVEEWSGCSHWTTKINIAKYFSKSMDADDFIEDFGKERGKLNITDSLSLFTKTIFCIDNATNVLPLGSYLRQLTTSTVDENIINEDEVTIINCDFIIDSVEFEGNYSFCKVHQINKTI